MAISSASSSDLAVENVRIEYRGDAFGIGSATPHLSWQATTNTQAWHQLAYALEARRPDGSLYGETGRLESPDCVLLPWPFAPLESRMQLDVRVKIWGSDGQESGWSEPTRLEVALLHAADWQARFITPDWDEDISKPQPAALLRRSFSVRSNLRYARLYITSLGVYEGQINGHYIGDVVLDPGWTSYHHRLRYRSFDVTEMLHEGENVLAAMLGDGWFRGRLGFGGGRRNLYGERLALLAQLELHYADGSIERVLSDQQWRATTGPILMSDIYDGERYDARLEREGWAASGYDDSDWQGVRPLDYDLATLIAPVGPPVRRIELLPAKEIITTPSGKTIVDFGQNLVGWVRLNVTGEAGQTVTLRHAEVLEHGELCTRPLRHAEATDSYTLRGSGVETWEPRFTFHGFRYVEVSGWPTELHLADLWAVVVHSDLERRGWFECSDSLLNQLHENVVWGMRGNFLAVPTDCPQRDERLGWTGDIQVFSPTASFLYDVSGFLSSWLADLAAEQQDDGVIPFVVPGVPANVPAEFIQRMPAAAAWGDAATVVPWVLYQRYGDKDILARQFESMCRWVDLLATIAGESRLWDTGFQFGDWLDPAAPPDKPAAARTAPFIVATAYFARSAELTAQAAQVLGKDVEAAFYQNIADEVREAFANEYVTPRGRLVSDASTAYSLAIEFGLLRDAAQRQHAGQRLAELARENTYRISTGFVGTPLICDALCSVGEHETAFRLLTERECPSWLYPVTMGATTIWERWDSMLPDGSGNPGEMTSFNHYALGAVADWMHRFIGGLSAAAPGYRRLLIAPHPGVGLSSARTRHHTPYGLAEVSWSLTDGQLTVEALVPPGVTATVRLPGREDFEVGSGSYVWEW